MTAWTIARHEIKLAFRSKWLLVFAGLFTLLAGIIIFFTGQSSGDFDGFTRGTASLLNLSLFLLPLLTLLVGGLLVAGEKEDGRLGLLLTYPLSSLSVILGKYIGLAVSLVFILVLGYGVSAGLFFQSSGSNVSLLLVFFGTSVLLVLMFLSLALFVGIIAAGRLQALGIGLFLWAFFVLFYEFIMMAMTMVTGPAMVVPLLTVSVFLNPVELIRVFTVLFLGSGTIFGPSVYDFTIWAEGNAGVIMFVVACFFWIVIPLWLANFVMNRGKTL
ncbi:ABC transporter permease subunit [Bacillus sp. REN10]|uniref:ABC transporter permease subunit n=1 Tax=Bacillus sp. REN10 TaxID=2782541 RepID=UPI00193C2987